MVSLRSKPLAPREVDRDGKESSGPQAVNMKHSFESQGHIDITRPSPFASRTSAKFVTKALLNRTIIRAPTQRLPGLMRRGVSALSSHGHFCRASQGRAACEWDMIVFGATPDSAFLPFQFLESTFSSVQMADIS